MKQQVSLIPPRFLTFRLFMLQGLFWSSFCFYFGFLVTFLSEQGYSPSLAGLSMTLVAAVNMLASPLVGFLCDRGLSQKKLILISFAVGIPLIFLLPLTLHSPLLTFLSIGLVSFCGYPMGIAIDAWIMALKQQYPSLNYGVCRSGGSMLYAVNALIFGNLFSNFGLHWMFICAAITFLLVIIIVAAIPAPKVKATHEHIPFPEAFSALKRNWPFLFFLSASFLLFTAINSIVTLQPLAIAQFGGTSKELGLCLFIMAISEVPAFILASKLLRFFGIRKLVGAAFIVYIFRIFTLYLASDISVFIAVQAIQGIAFGLFQAGGIAYVTKLVPKKLSSTGIMTFGAVVSGLANITGNACGGFLADRFGVSPVFLMGTFLAAFSCLFLFIAFYLQKRTENNE